MALGQTLSINDIPWNEQTYKPRVHWIASRARPIPNPTWSQVTSIFLDLHRISLSRVFSRLSTYSVVVVKIFRRKSFRRSHPVSGKKFLRERKNFSCSPKCVTVSESSAGQGADLRLPAGIRVPQGLSAPPSLEITFALVVLQLYIRHLTEEFLRGLNLCCAKNLSRTFPHDKIFCASMPPVHFLKFSFVQVIAPDRLGGVLQTEFLRTMS